MSRADLALQDTDAPGAAEYGRLALWEHSLLFAGLGAAYTAAGQSISAGAPPQPFTRFGFRFSLLFVTRILRVHSILVFPQNSKAISYGTALRTENGRYFTEFGRQPCHDPSFSDCF